MLPFPIGTVHFDSYPCDRPLHTRRIFESKYDRWLDCMYSEYHLSDTLGILMQISNVSGYREARVNKDQNLYIYTRP
jgi:hypothetical protein